MTAAPTDTLGTVQGDKAVPAREREGPPPSGHPPRQNTGERVHSAGAHHHQVPVPCPTGGGNGGGGEGTTTVHVPYGGMASLATDAAVQRGAPSPAAASPGVAAQVEKATGAGQAGRMRSTNDGTTRALPGERRSEAQHRSIRDGLFCGAGATLGRHGRTTIPTGGAVEPFPTGSMASPIHPVGQMPSG